MFMNPIGYLWSLTALIIRINPAISKNKMIEFTKVP
jgi:hypothetical protein